MNEPKKIKLFASRDFSENFDLALTFIKLNYGAVLKPLCILIPVIIISVFVAPDMSNISTDIYSYDNPLDIYGEIFTLGYFISLFLGRLAVFLLSLYVIAYMAVYSQTKDGIVKMSEVWNKVLNTVLPVFVTSIIFWILVSIGSMLCLIPGIIVFVYLGFFDYVYINENRGIIGSLQRSYELVQGNFWTTLGIGLVFGILIAIGSIIFTIPTYFTSFGMIFGVEFFSNSIFIYIASLISSLGQFLLLPIIYMAMGVVYYSLRNQSDNIDEDSEIDSIGTFNNEENNTSY